MSTPANIPFTLIQFDSATQIRAEIDPQVVSDYAEAMRAGEKFPPLEVFEGTDKGGIKIYFLGDGWHRALAYQENGDVTVPAHIHEGGKAEAIAYALSANARHGLKRCTADKIKAVRVAFERFAGMSDRAIAELCAVSPTFVGKHRPQLSTVDSCQRKGMDGRTRSLPTGKPVVAKAGSVLEAMQTPVPQWSTPLTAMEQHGLRELQRQTGDVITNPEKTDEELEAAARAYVAAHPEEQAKIEAIKQEAAMTAAPVAEVRAPILKPSQGGGGAFDSAKWKLRAREVLVAWMAEVPAKHRQAAAEYLRNQVSEIEQAGA